MFDDLKNSPLAQDLKQMASLVKQMNDHVSDEFSKTIGRPTSGLITELSKELKIVWDRIAKRAEIPGAKAERAEEEFEAKETDITHQGIF